MRISRLGPGDEAVVLAGRELFDKPPTTEWAAGFLAREGHHLLFALSDDDEPIGFVSGVETMHPDKGTEMFLYELAVDEPFRRRGIGKALVSALAEIAVDAGCYGMWVGTDHDNVAALATYRSTGAEPPEPSVTLTWRFTTS